MSTTDITAEIEAANAALVAAKNAEEAAWRAYQRAVTYEPSTIDARLSELNAAKAELVKAQTAYDKKVQQKTKPAATTQTSKVCQALDAGKSAIEGLKGADLHDIKSTMADAKAKADSLSASVKAEATAALMAAQDSTNAVAVANEALTAAQKRSAAAQMAYDNETDPVKKEALLSAWKQAQIEEAGLMAAYEERVRQKAVADANAASVNKLVEDVSGKLNELNAKVGELQGQLNDALASGKNLVSGLVSGLQDGMNNLKSAAKGALGSLMPNLGGIFKNPFAGPLLEVNKAHANVVKLINWLHARFPGEPGATPNEPGVPGDYDFIIAGSPPDQTAIPGNIYVKPLSLSEITSHVFKKMSNLPQELAMAGAVKAQKAALSMLDAKASGTVPSVDEIKEKFGLKMESSGCGNYTAKKEPDDTKGFQSITEAPGMVLSFKDKIYEAFATLHTDLGLDPEKNIIKDFDSLVGDLDASMFTNVTKVQQAFINYNNAVSAMQAELSSIVASENALSQANMGFMNGTAMLNLLSAPPTSLAGNVVDKVIDKEAINPKVMSAISPPPPGVPEVVPPTTVAIQATASPTFKPIDAEPPATEIKRNPYSTKRLTEMKAKVDAKQDEYDRTSAQLAKLAEDWVGYLISVKWVQVKSAARVQTTGEAQFTDPGGLGADDPNTKAWIKLRNEVKEVHDGLVITTDDLKKQEIKLGALAQQYRNEYAVRSEYGKNPYTQMEREGIKPAFISTFLDDDPDTQI